MSNFEKHTGTENSKINKINTDFTLDEWRKKGVSLFGQFPEDWKFVCPHCGNVASGLDFKEAGAEPDSIYCECIGRYVKGKGCDWAAYGLFDICTVHVDGQPVFEFYEKQPAAAELMGGGNSD